MTILLPKLIQQEHRSCKVYSVKHGGLNLNTNASTTTHYHISNMCSTRSQHLQRFGYTINKTTHLPVFFVRSMTVLRTIFQEISTIPRFGTTSASIEWAVSRQFCMWRRKRPPPSKHQLVLRPELDSWHRVLQRSCEKPKLSANKKGVVILASPETSGN